MIVENKQRVHQRDELREFVVLPCAGKLEGETKRSLRQLKEVNFGDFHPFCFRVKVRNGGSPGFRKRTLNHTVCLIKQFTPEFGVMHQKLTLLNPSLLSRTSKPFTLSVLGPMWEKVYLLGGSTLGLVPPVKT